jgi:hypothetical protein
MRSTSLDMDSRVTRFQQPAGLLYIASSIKEHTINTSAKRIQLLYPRIEQGRNERGIFFAAVDKMIGTCV